MYVPISVHIVCVCVCVCAHAVHVLLYTSQFLMPLSGSFHVLGSDTYSVCSAIRIVSSNGFPSGTYIVWLCTYHTDYWHRSLCNTLPICLRMCLQNRTLNSGLQLKIRGFCIKCSYESLHSGHLCPGTSKACHNNRTFCKVEKNDQLPFLCDVMKFLHLLQAKIQSHWLLLVFLGLWSSTKVSNGMT